MRSEAADEEEPDENEDVAVFGIFDQTVSSFLVCVP